MARRRSYPGSIERRGDSYRITLRIGGKRHRFTIQTLDRKLAETAAINKYAELKRDSERKAAGLPDTIGVIQLIDLYESTELPTLAPGTVASYKDSLKPIRRYFDKVMDNPPVIAVRAAHILDYLAWRRVHRIGRVRQKKEERAPLSNRTLQKDRAVLHRLFALAELREFREGNPVGLTDRPKSDDRDPIILTTDQYAALLKQAEGHPMLYPYIAVLGETGMRCESEVLFLQWSDVSFDTGFIKVVTGRDGHRTKSGKSRLVPMTPFLRQTLQAHFAEYRMAMYDRGRSPFVFHNTITRARHRAGERIGSLRNGFNGAAGRAELPKEFRQHDLRHRRVTTWLADGKSPIAVMHAMGHSDIKVTMGYYRFLPEHLRGLVDQEPELQVLKTLASA